ncbi:MAG TPA: hypothetical protein V6C81_12105 [Planktothrix sp.]
MVGSSRLVEIVTIRFPPEIGRLPGRDRPTGALPAASWVMQVLCFGERKYSDRRANNDDSTLAIYLYVTQGALPGSKMKQEPLTPGFPHI